MTTNAHNSIKATRLSRDLSEMEIANISGGHGESQTCSCPEGSVLIACDNGIALCAYL